MIDQNVDLFLKTAEERHLIYIRKRILDSPKPWTEDEIFQRFFFCNLFRQYDKCSQWMIDNIIPKRRWDLIVLYRYISTHKTYRKLQDNIDLNSLDEAERFLLEMKKEGETVFSSCFIRNPHSCEGVVGAHQVPFILIKEMKRNGWSSDGSMRDFLWTTLQELHRELMRYGSVGKFMAYEYACDMEYTDEFHPTDKNEWCSLGPGAMKGLNILVTGSAHRRYDKKIEKEYIQELYLALKDRIEREFPSETITMREVEHWLCEFCKYVKYMGFVRSGGRVKFRKYEGGC